MGRGGPEVGRRKTHQLKDRKMKMEHFAKIFTETGNASGLTRDDFHRELEKRALLSKHDGESFAQAYTRVSLQPENREIFKAANNAPAAPPKPAPQDLKPEPAGPASKELEDLARSMAKEKKYSYQQAFSRLYTDPERGALVRRYDKEQAELKQRISTARFPLRNAENESRTESWVNELNEVGRHRYRPNSQ
jgi:hypothetical protein